DLSDYVYWEHDVAKQVHPKEAAYWQQKMKNASLLYVPDSYFLRSGETARSQAVELDRTLMDALARISLQYRVSLPMSLAAVIAITLHRLTSQNDICITTVFENRLYPDIKHLISPMMIPLPIRIQLSNETSFAGLIAQVKNTMLEAYGHAQASWAMPLYFLYRNLLPDNEVKKQERGIRFFTRLLTRLVYPAQSYPNLFYAALRSYAGKVNMNNGSAGDKHNSQSDSSFSQPGMEVRLNIATNFYQTANSSDYKCGDVNFSRGALQAGMGLIAAQDNVLNYNFFKNKQGNPMIRIYGGRFTAPAYLLLTNSFRDVLITVVNNPDGDFVESLTEMTTKST
ncbi:MAG: hypothetical protein JSW07_10395, partial [bacterium]